MALRRPVGLPEGPTRVFFDRLHKLYLQDNLPTLGELVKKINAAAAGPHGRVPRSTLAAAISERLGAWRVYEPLIQALGGDPVEFQPLWQAAELERNSRAILSPETLVPARGRRRWALVAVPVVVCVVTIAIVTTQFVGSGDRPEALDTPRSAASRAGSSPVAAAGGPRITLDTDHGSPTSRFTVTGTGWNPHRQINIWIDGRKILSHNPGDTRETTGFSVDFSPNNSDAPGGMLAPGVHTVSAVTGGYEHDEQASPAVTYTVT